jgi:hypothetical protein
MKRKRPTEEFVPKALREVWEWKDAIYQEVKHLPTDQALREIIRRAQAESRKLGFTPSSPTKPAVVPESRAKYRAKR